jgi:seryl-tRNA synthetase
MTASAEPGLDGIQQRDPFLVELAKRNLLVLGQAPGVDALGAPVERIVWRLHDEIGGLRRQHHGPTLHFPPVLSRATLERSGYLEGFVQLAGSIHGFAGDDAARLDLIDDLSRGADWGHHQALSDTILAPAVCYHVYPLLEGRLAPGGREVNAFSYCYRHENTVEAGRFRAFRVEEFVYANDRATCERWREEWLQRGTTYLRGLGLTVRRELASDPFFGSTRRLLAADQRQRRLKYELQVPLRERWLAVSSYNLHDDHFGRRFGIDRNDGEIAETACVGFGLERIALALLAEHGLDLDAWPANLRGRLCR